jgi:heme O synthase-like polyprenyltransferase
MSQVRDYARLVRLPNLPTALADICLGALATGALPGSWLPFLLLLPASGCLYCGGMVWNDFFDVDQDRRERPDRPIPSGRVTRRHAGVFGAVLLTVGVLLALLAGMARGLGADGASRQPATLACLLVGCIFLYDGWLKRTPAGPLAMGSCRFLNVLLGVSVVGSLPSRGLYLAAIVGLYIVGVTWFARTEARISNRSALQGAAAVMLTALLLAIPLPVIGPPVPTSMLFPYLLVALGFAIGLPASRAIAEPSPANVQAAVKRAIFALVVLDAVLATAVAGWVGLVILILLAPSLYLSRRRWLYAT